MTDPNHVKPGMRPGGGGPEKPTSASTGTASSDKAAGPDSSGRVVHDSRGNAVWQWVKDTGRHAIESTSALLKKLEVPELEVEDKDDSELRLEDDVDAGGGYDPYGTRVGSKKPPPPKTPFKKR
ncbi:MAG TPA: hypothetical protein VNY82_08175 [Steroidobacteraceae bacterium]|jgi:hypothetical protein|nr:hypothetical protein [Steroidobacteraceae bacterium]